MTVTEANERCRAVQHTTETDLCSKRDTWLALRSNDESLLVMIVVETRMEHTCCTKNGSVRAAR